VLTDGVPEAMHGRELFGFDRTLGLSARDAAEIAEAARRFGQNDDITVVSIDVLPTPAAWPRTFRRCGQVTRSKEQNRRAEG
jgi:hypothetical protein